MGFCTLAAILPLGYQTVVISKWLVGRYGLLYMQLLLVDWTLAKKGASATSGYLLKLPFPQATGLKPSPVIYSFTASVRGNSAHDIAAENSSLDM